MIGIAMLSFRHVHGNDYAGEVDEHRRERASSLRLTSIRRP
jgi:hypothetical protein